MGRIRLMLADDEAPILEAMCELVSTDRYIDVVGTARDASEAIDLAELHEPDVALLDVRMPGGGGSRAAREIRRRSPETRIVALSASTDPRTVASMVRAGAVGYVGKDQPADEVLRADPSVRRRTGQHRGRSPGRGGGTARRAPGESGRAGRRASSRLDRPDRGSDPRRCDSRRCSSRSWISTDGRVRGVEALARFMTTTSALTRDLVRRGGESRAAHAARARRRDQSVRSPRPDPRRRVPLGERFTGDAARPSSDRRCCKAVPARRVVLELTERSPIVDYDEARACLAEVRALGCRLAVDDVGKRVLRARTRGRALPRPPEVRPEPRERRRLRRHQERAHRTADVVRGRGRDGDRGRGDRNRSGARDPPRARRRDRDRGSCSVDPARCPRPSMARSGGRARTG